MAKQSLVIVESPAKAKTIGKYLGKDYEVKACMGHLRDLQKSKLSVDVDNDFEPVYKPIKGKEAIISDLKKSAKAADRPGVTRGSQWFRVESGIDLLDTPGILWPKFEDEKTGMDLAFTGAVKDDIMDVETLGCHLMALLGQRYPQALTAAYKLPEVPAQEAEENEVAYGYRLLCLAGQKRGMKISGGEVDTERMARVLLDEYRAGKLGTFTLEVPEGV